MTTETRVLVIEPDAEVRQRMGQALAALDCRVWPAADLPAALAQLAQEPAHLVLANPAVAPAGADLPAALAEHHPTLPVVLISKACTVAEATHAMRGGASDVLDGPWTPERLAAVVARNRRPLADEHRPVAEDPRSRDLLTLAERVAQSDVTVTLCGESGTGKEVLARFIHARSRRADGPFVAVNCAAIPEPMLEAILFGFEKGAFTGAHQTHTGKFEQAQGGTLLLDEVADIDLGLQAKLLRVLQEREVERLCGRRPIPLDVRVLAATNRDLTQAVAEGRFREDLFYRLNVFPLRLTPLRERPGDILPLARTLLRRCHDGAGNPPVLSAAAQGALLAHPWPGNVRELENVIQRALILRTGAVIDKEHLVFEPAEAVAAASGAADRLEDNLRQQEQGLILETLKAANGNRKVAAERLGISPRTLRYKLARMRAAGLDVPGGWRVACA